MKVGEVFAGILDSMSDYVVRHDGMKYLASIPDNENGAYWKELHNPTVRKILNNSYVKTITTGISSFLNPNSEKDIMEEYSE